MVLLNKQTGQIMFVEGKVFSDKRVNVAVGFVPEVIEQVNNYTAAIKKQAAEIIMQYAEHIRIVNLLFNQNFKTKLELIETAKLIVYGTPAQLNKNGLHSKQMINDKLGCENVVWCETNKKLSLDEIWSRLCK